MMIDKRATMKEVSRLSGVSIATVSRVIHHNGRFSAETEQRVRRAMEELRYEPDVIAQVMRTHAMPTVGVIIPDVMDDNMALMTRTVQKILFTHGYTTELYNSFEDGNQSRHFIERLDARHAAGLICVPDSRAVKANYYDLPTVFFDREPIYPPAEKFAMITQTNQESAQKAVLKLFECGCRQIAILGDKYGLSNHTQRMAGAVEAIRMNGKEPAAVVVVDPQRTSEALEAFGELLNSETMVDGVFCTSSQLVIGALSALKLRKINQTQLRVAGYGTARLYDYGLLDYLAVKEPIEEMSTAVAETLLAMIDGEVTTITNSIFKAQLQE